MSAGTMADDLDCLIKGIVCADRIPHAAMRAAMGTRGRWRRASRRSRAGAVPGLADGAPATLNQKFSM